MKKREIEKWRRLDNSAKLFPLLSTTKYSNVFRISAVLKEKINPDILKEAVIKALETLKCFKVKLKKGLFWYYFEENFRDIIIEEEKTYPCKYIDPQTNNEYLFKVTYFENKINLEIFHALTDGNSGTRFMQEITYNYIELAHKDRFQDKKRTERKISYNTEDSYMKNYNKKLPGNASGKKAYILKGKKYPLDMVGVTHEIMDIGKLKEIAKENEATVTQYLTAVLIYSIYQANYKKNNSKKPIKICIPVNLKKYFKSETISNFFSYITIEANMEDKKLQDFENILEFVKKDFKNRLTYDEINKTMSSTVKIGNNPFIKGIPLFLKKVLIQISYIEIRKYTTTTFSNIGRIGIIGDYQEYIKEFLFLIAPEKVEKIKCSACSYNDKLIFTFTSILREKEIENYFLEFLKSQGLNVEVESNGV